MAMACKCKRCDRKICESKSLLLYCVALNINSIGPSAKPGNKLIAIIEFAAWLTQNARWIERSIDQLVGGPVQHLGELLLKHVLMRVNAVAIKTGRIGEVRIAKRRKSRRRTHLMPLR